jgi:putative DNA primase/helicase
MSALTEHLAARLFADAKKDELRYCHTRQIWLLWDGSLWRPDTLRSTLNEIRTFVQSLPSDSPQRTGRAGFFNAVERLAQADPLLARNEKDWDSDAFLLGTPNGTVDLKTGKLRPAEPNDGITKSVAVTPILGTSCPLWMSFLDDSFCGDGATIRFVQRWCGYCLTGDTRENKLVFSVGSGGNGKSVFINTIGGILSAYATTSALETFTASKYDRHLTELAKLRGARLVTATESEEGRPWAEARIKQLTGGDTISARFMRQDHFDFRPEFKLMFAGNHVPTLHNVDEAIRRRFLLLPFNQVPERPDHELERKLRAEWSAILGWMIEGCLDWQVNGLIRPASVDFATHSYFSSQDQMQQWLDDCCAYEVGNQKYRAPSSALFESWKRYALHSNEQPGTKKAFALRLQSKGFGKSRKSGERGFSGLCLKKPMTDDGS